MKCCKPFFASAFASLLFLAGCARLSGPNGEIPGGDQEGKDTVRIAFGSCIRYPEVATWKSIDNLRPDVMLFLGDNIYMSANDLGDAERIRRRYGRLLKAAGMPELLSHTKPIAVWDDHDFGPNNADSSFPAKDVSLTEFRRAWPNNPPPPRGLEESVSSDVTVGPVELLVLDDRTYRRNYKQDSEPQMFGEKQVQWIETRLKETTSPFIVLANGTQWLSTSHIEEPGVYETLWQYPSERDRLMKAIADSPATVILLSGDRHFAEVLQVPLAPGRVLYDLTSSPLSAPLAPASSTGAEINRAALAVGRLNFGMLTINGREHSATFQLYDESGQPILEWPLQISKKE
ncbi:MAG: alkaline phosphatase D family protein [Bdellovibrionota bacterium]